MSNHEDASDRSDSLLRRSLHQGHEPRVPDDEPPPPPEKDPSDAPLSPIPGYTVPAQPQDADDPEAPLVSPIRPTVQDDTEPQDPLTPSPPQHQPDDDTPLSPREQMQRAEEALIRLREKMARVAAEFADGKLNRDQFDAIYSRYSEQRDITERLLARDPESQAWQSVVQPGHTSFLKEHYAARVVSYAIYNLQTFALITITGLVQIEHGQLESVLQRLNAIIAERGNPGPAHKSISNGQSVLFVPGTMTVAVAVFSREPAAVQISRVQDIHNDFERANRHALQRQDYTPERLVFPHRALFEDSFDAP